ncbi:MAG: hypothetical protein M3P94_01805 [Chloroflexota bacterium]|nr:hypothetical protein [Chloroflexota bacterium]
MILAWVFDVIGGCLTILAVVAIFCLLGLGVFVMFGGFEDSKGNGYCTREEGSMGQQVVTCEPH